MIVIKELYWDEVKCEDKIKERVNFQCGLWTYENENKAQDALITFKEKLLKEKNWELEDEGKTWFRAKNNNSFVVFEIKELPENANTYIDLY